MPSRSLSVLSPFSPAPFAWWSAAAALPWPSLYFLSSPLLPWRPALVVHRQRAALPSPPCPPPPLPPRPLRRELDKRTRPDGIGGVLGIPQGSIVTVDCGWSFAMPGTARPFPLPCSLGSSSSCPLGGSCILRTRLCRLLRCLVSARSTHTSHVFVRAPDPDLRWQPPFSFALPCSHGKSEGTCSLAPGSRPSSLCVTRTSGRRRTVHTRRFV